ncbi:MAG: CoA transferase [Deltaproteobacteria bacterium]|nr:CoA transferase [Deltaproteobacteria bacterium]
MKPLDGIVVIDLTRVLAGPYATMILRNLGARVIKVERPGVGDDARHFGPFHNGESGYFASINAAKESITLDLKHDAGKQLLGQLVGHADVLVENFVPGVMEHLGLGYAELRRINPRLIYAAASGFGHTGPGARMPAYDMIVQAAGGVMSITGSPEPDAAPVRVGTSIGDITAALFTAIGIVSALYQRTITGQGQMVDVGMLDAQVAILENAIARHELTGQPPRPLGTAHPSITPFQAFRTRDSWIIMAAGNDKLWHALCECMGREDLLGRAELRTNDLRTEHRAELEQELTRSFKEKITAEWQQILERAHVPASPINTVDKVLALPQILARHMVVETSFGDGTKLKIAGNPIKMSSFEDETKIDPVPLLGQHTELVLGSLLGLDAAQIRALRAERAI